MALRSAKAAPQPVVPAIAADRLSAYVKLQTNRAAQRCEGDVVGNNWKFVQRLVAVYGYVLREADVTDWPWWRALPIHLARVLAAVVLDLTQGLVSMRAMSLVYTTLLSLVPLLAISFSVLKGFGAHNQMEPLLMQLLAPLGEKGAEITEQIIGFVENMNVGVLGSLGLGFLMLTVISLMQKIERAVNFAWRITQHRSFAQRFSSYLTVIVIGPVLVFSAVGITASLVAAPLVSEFAAIEPVGKLFESAARIVPFMLIVSAFTFLYIFMPNTRVRFGPALAGGLFAGMLWQTVGWVFASFVVTSGQYDAIYSAFATLILFLIWLYLGWLILLLGASISFYVQNPRYIGGSYAPPVLSLRQREAVVLMVMREIARGFYRLRPLASARALAESLQLPLDTVDETLTLLERGKAVSRSGDTIPVFLPASAPEETMVSKILADARRSGESGVGALRFGQKMHGISAAMDQLDGAVAGAFEGVSVKDLAHDSHLDNDESQPGGTPTLLRDNARRAGLGD